MIAADEQVVTPIVVVVDALHERAASFYRRCGFVPFPERPQRLAVRLKDVRATFGPDQIH